MQIYLHPDIEMNSYCVLSSPMQGGMDVVYYICHDLANDRTADLGGTGQTFAYCELWHL